MAFEISLSEIWSFLKRTYKTIFFCGATGLFAAFIYLAVTPKQYEAIAQITMAQISAGNNSIQGINIEDPALLIARMSSPTSFTPQAIADCGLEEHVNGATILTKSIKLTIPKGIANVVELKTFGFSPQAAEQCNLAIVDLIKNTQSLLAAPYIAEAKARVENDIERLEKAKDLLVKADRSGSAVGGAYLSARDEIRHLLDEIAVLKNIVTFNQNRTSRLISPIYAGNAPIAPRKRNVLAGGLFGGLFLGLVIAMAIRLIPKLTK